MQILVKIIKKRPKMTKILRRQLFESFLLVSLVTHSQHALDQNKPNFRVLAGVAGMRFFWAVKHQNIKEIGSAFNISNISCCFDPEGGSMHN